MKKKQVLCVAYGADDKYAKYLGISMLSLFQTNKDFDEINVFVMDLNIGASNKEKLISIAANFNRNIVFIPINDYVSKLNLKMGSRKIGIASYARLFLASVIPEIYNKILYLDCDTIVSNSLTEYWNIDINGYMLAGVRDTVDKYFLNRIGLRSKDYYVNAGVLLINLKAWRYSQVQDQFIELILRFNGNVPHHDQGTINATCNKKIKIVSPSYNVISNIYSFSAKSIKRMYSMDSFYSQGELDQAKKNPVIVHYTTGLVGRPWEEHCTHPKKEDYLRVAKASPWKDELIIPDSRKSSVKMFGLLYKYTPHLISDNIYRLINMTIGRIN